MARPLAALLVLSALACGGDPANEHPGAAAYRLVAVGETGLVLHPGETRTVRVVLARDEVGGVAGALVHFEVTGDGGALTSGSQDAKPCTSAATDRDCEEASTTSTTGARSSFATCAVDDSSPMPEAPSNSPITPSTTARSAPAAPCRNSGAIRSGPHRYASSPKTFGATTGEVCC